MHTRLLASLVALSVLVGFPLSLDAAADRVPATVTLPPSATEVAPGVFTLGPARDVDGTLVEGFAILHPKRAYHHRPGHAGGPGGSGGTCFAFLGQGARWKATEFYSVDSTNQDGLTDSFVRGAIGAATEAWDTQVAFEVFGAEASGTVNGIDTITPDGTNEVLFASIDSPGAVAVTIVWGIFSGPPQNRSLVEWDQAYDDADFDFGDATVNPAVMDFLNVAVHEVGHAAGMAHPNDSCTEETMYRFVSTGETKKRDLGTGDIAGIQSLYP